MSKKLRVTIALTAVAVLGCGATAALALDPAVESKNFSKTQERSAIFSTPEYQAQLRQGGAQKRADATAAAAGGRRQHRARRRGAPGGPPEPTLPPPRAPPPERGPRGPPPPLGGGPK